MDPLVTHLANLKFYGRFKREKRANSFDQYIEYMDSGAPDDFQWKSEGIQVLELYEFDDPFYGDLADPETEEAVDQFLSQRGSEKPQLNLDDWYNDVKYYIDYLLKRYKTKKIKSSSTFRKLEEILTDYPLVKNYIQISEEDFYTYCSHMQDKAPEDFIAVFSRKKISDYPIIDCYPRIFMNCKSYAFFEELKKEVENTAADYSFIFYQMRDDKLIHFYCKDDYQELINKDSETPIEIYSESKVKNSKFKSKYSQIYQNMY